MNCFFQMPKTASASVHDIIAGRCFEIGHGPGDPMTVQRFRMENPNAFIFTFVRNPFDRLVSAYSYLLKDHTHPILIQNRKDYIEPYRDFREFVLKGVESQHVLQQTHFKSQASRICCWAGSLLTNWVGHYERLQADVNEICSRFGWEAKDLPILNKSKHHDYREYYDADMASVVVKAYRRDFEIGGYATTI